MVRAVAVSGDPAEDTPASVRRFLAARRAEGRLDYLLGEERSCAPCGRRCSCSPRSTPAVTRSTRRRFASTTARRLGRDPARRRRPEREENLLHDIRTALAGDDDTSG